MLRPAPSGSRPSLAKELLGPVGVVRATPQLQVLHDGLAACRKRHGMMVELEESALATSPALSPDERAAATIAKIDRPLDVRRDVARSAGPGSRRSGFLGDGKLPPHEILHQQAQRARDDLGGIAAWNGVPQQVLSQLEHLARFRARGEGDLVPVGRERLHEGPRRRWNRRMGGHLAGGKSRLGAIHDGGFDAHDRRCGRRRSCADACRQLPDRERHVRLRESFRQQLLHLPLALAASGREQLLLVLAREMRSQQADGREVDLPRGKQPQDCRIPPHNFGRLHPVVGLVLREMEDLEAIDEERREAGALVEAPRVELGQVRDQGGRGLSLG